MKRIKIMLMSIALVAVVGGALAFKAKYNIDFCTAVPDQGACPAEYACPNEELLSKIDPASPLGFVCTTIKPIGIACNDGVLCTTEPSVKLTSDNP